MIDIFFVIALAGVPEVGPTTESCGGGPCSSAPIWVPPTPSPFDSAMAEANRALKDERWSDAEAHLRRALEENPHAIEAKSNLARALKRQGRLEQAEEILEEVLTLDEMRIEDAERLFRIKAELEDRKRERESRELAAAYRAEAERLRSQRLAAQEKRREEERRRDRAFEQFGEKLKMHRTGTAFGQLKNAATDSTEAGMKLDPVEAPKTSGKQFDRGTTPASPKPFWPTRRDPKKEKAK